MNMKAIINGKRYDTDKAIEVGSYGTHLGRGDFREWNASLYKTPRAGAFFLAGEGHGMTAFCSSSPDGMRGWGSKLIPMSREEALEWAEQYLTTATIEEHFGDDVQDA
jgi:hypothetical protein